MIRRGKRALIVSLSRLTLLAGVLAAAPDAQGRAATQSPPATINFQGREIPNTLEEILDPKHAAVIGHGERLGKPRSL